MNTAFLQNNLLFRGMNETELSECLSVLHAETRTYRKNSLILCAGDSTDRMGIVLSGSVTIESNDIWGNCTVLSNVGVNDFFGETYALTEKTVLLVDARANEDSSILSLRIGGLLNHTPGRQEWYIRLLQNLLMISARKNLVLSGRSFHTASKTIRGKILSYLNSVSLQKHTSEFDIPFSRQQMADYLNVERTALSKELGKMRSDGMIQYRRNHFVLLKSE